MGYQKVVDISQWQGDQPDFPSLAKEGAWVIARLGHCYTRNAVNEYEDYDTKWDTYASKCNKLGIPLGAYWYSNATTYEAGKREAEHALKRVRSYDISLPIFFDSEEHGTQNGCVQAAKGFCETIEANGYRAGVYASESWWTNYLTGISGYVRWVANTSREPQIGWDIWQWGFAGKNPAVPYGDADWARYDLLAEVRDWKAGGYKPMKLYVIAGHGAGDPGACGNGYQEAERVRALAKEIVARGNGQVGHYDYDRDCYQDNGLSGYNPGCPVMELHMDSASASARGGHVIIPVGYGGPDEHDNALAAMLGEMLPGRPNLIVERDDLQNCNVAKSRGIDYRLVEFGFISNTTDLGIFNANIGTLADRILSIFGIAGSSPHAADTIQRGDHGEVVKALQRRLIKLGYDVGAAKDDGDFGECTENAVKRFQRKNLLVDDGQVGPLTQAKLDAGTHWNYPLKDGHYFGAYSKDDDNNHSGYYIEEDRWYVRMIQAKLGVTTDGLFGEETKAAAKKWQADNGLYVDGIIGPISWKKMF